MPDTNDDLLKEAKKRLEAAWEHDKENRDEAIHDLRFLAGDQWPEDIRQQRETQGRPCLTLDHLTQYKNQVVNDIRQAKIGIKAVGVDDETDPELAEIYTGIMRDVQHQNSAQHVYSQAADGAVSCGIGHFRFDTAYANEQTFEQEIKIKNIPYPLAVYWDPASVLPDRSDAMWCFVVDFMPMITFEDRYPKAHKADIDVPGDYAGSFRWATREGVLIAEYWCKKPRKKRIAGFEDGSTLDITDIPEDILAMLPPITQEREAEGFKVEQALITGMEVLDGPNKWAGSHIPIIPIVGTEVCLEKKTVRMGLIRLARDGQQLYNYWRSAAAELIALAPKAKWLVTAKQIQGRTAEWDKMHLSPKPYAVYTPDEKAQQTAPQLVPPPEPPAAIWQEAALVVDDIKASMGMYDASVGAKSNETSGVAIRQRQQEGDVSTYHFSDNLTRSLEHAGKVMIDLIGKVYDSERAVRIMGEDDQHEYIRINTAAMDVDGTPVLLNDLSQGRFDVRVSIGPSYTTQRLEAADSMLEYIKADPQAVPFIRDKIVKNLDWPGADEIAERLKRTIPAEVLGEDAPQQQPDPVNELAVKEAGAKVAETEGKARKVHAEADTTEMENAVMERQVASFGIPPPDHLLTPPPTPGGSPAPQGGPTPPQPGGVSGF